MLHQSESVGRILHWDQGEAQAANRLVVLTSPTGVPVLQPVPCQNPFVDQSHVRICAPANPVWESLL